MATVGTASKQAVNYASGGRGELHAAGKRGRIRHRWCPARDRHFN